MIKYILLLFLTGCSTNPDIKIKPIEVYTPIYVACKVETPKVPNFLFGTLKKEDDVFTKIKYTLGDLELHKAYEIELIAALSACKQE